jgi:hypothetical protein
MQTVSQETILLETNFRQTNLCQSSPRAAVLPQTNPPRVTTPEDKIAAQSLLLPQDTSL